MNIIWACINLFVFAAIINLALRIQKKYSNGSALIFLFFTFFVFSGNKSLVKNSPLNLSENAYGEKIGNFNINIKENSPNILLNGAVFKQKNNETIKTVASSHIYGLVLGYTWHHIALDLKKTDNLNNWHYILRGFLDYRIWGITIYSQQKILTGKAKLEN